ncbi:hypothetical protein [Fervidobacterium thailandense]|uniref:Uncharacterized protein n=1 Tax=Fervidobacterium thailandense TaxID=1008305 RepID=A0A1E3G0L6_9BACT|nr:hypothetical protein [Fervidobacterium thailandense]ODN29791.1 hypothetical protein A4H02_08805 [Fervidobacterium thailandense]
MRSVLAVVVGLTAYIVGTYFVTKVKRLEFAKLIQCLVLIALGLTFNNPLLVAGLTDLFLLTRFLYVPIRKDTLDDLKEFVFAKLILKSKTYLMLVLTGGTFLGLSLPAIKNYPTSISVITFVTVWLIYLVEKSNWNSFTQKFNKRIERSGDPLQALKDTYESMVLFSPVDGGELIRNRLEMRKNKFNDSKNT